MRPQRSNPHLRSIGKRLIQSYLVKNTCGPVSLAVDNLEGDELAGAVPVVNDLDAEIYRRYIEICLCIRFTDGGASLADVSSVEHIILNLEPVIYLAEVEELADVLTHAEVHDIGLVCHIFYVLS